MGYVADNYTIIMISRNSLFLSELECKEAIKDF